MQKLVLEGLAVSEVLVCTRCYTPSVFLDSSWLTLPNHRRLWHPYFQDRFGTRCSVRLRQAKKLRATNKAAKLLNTKSSLSYTHVQLFVSFRLYHAYLQYKMQCIPEDSFANLDISSALSSVFSDIVGFTSWYVSCSLKKSLLLAYCLTL